MNQLIRFSPVVARPEAFLDAKTGLMIAAEDLLGGSMTYADTEKAIKEFRAGGFSDWRLPTVDELNSLLDRTRYNPACDPALNMKSEGYWTSTPYAGGSDNAWYVHFCNGGVHYCNRYYELRVRAVRAASQ